MSMNLSRYFTNNKISKKAKKHSLEIQKIKKLISKWNTVKIKKNIPKIMK